MSQDSEFIKVIGKANEKTLYNLRYAKTLNCDDYKCTLTMANTETGYKGSNTGFHDTKFEDQVFECYRDKSPNCYYKISKFIDDHQ
jgi:hypothetical protein